MRMPRFMRRSGATCFTCPADCSRNVCSNTDIALRRSSSVETSERLSKSATSSPQWAHARAPKPVQSNNELCSRSRRTGHPGLLRPAIAGADSPRLCCLVRRKLRVRRFDLGNFDIEEERLSGKWMIEVHNDGVFFDLMHPHGDALPIRAARRQHGADFQSFRRKLVFGNFLESLRVYLSVSLFR